MTDTLQAILDGLESGNADCADTALDSLIELHRVIGRELNADRDNCGYPHGDSLRRWIAAERTRMAESAAFNAATIEEATR